MSDLLEPKVKTREASSGAATRIAFVRPRTQLALAMADALVANMTFNGKSALANGDNLTQVLFNDPNDADLSYIGVDIDFAFTLSVPF